MRLRWTLILPILGLPMFLLHGVSSVNPLTEDLNCNAVPDIIELQHGTFHTIPIMGISATVAVVLIVVAVYVLHQYRTALSGMEYRHSTDISMKIFKSKYRGVIRTKLWVLAVLGVLLGGLVLVSAYKTTNPLSEDSDGDGLPSVVETQVGTDPNDPLSQTYVANISDIGVDKNATLYYYEYIYPELQKIRPKEIGGE